MSSSKDASRTSDWAKQGLTTDMDQGELFERAFRHAAIGMALVDLDGRWLKVNDALCQTFGYSRAELMALDFQTITHAGDLVLRRIADAIQSQARTADLVARWGGEEFVALLSSERGGARLFAERVRAAVEALELPQVGRVTISLGIGEYAGGGTGDAMLAEADAMLYAAKAQGRNRVCD